MFEMFHAPDGQPIAIDLHEIVGVIMSTHQARGDCVMVLIRGGDRIEVQSTVENVLEIISNSTHARLSEDPTYFIERLADALPTLMSSIKDAEQQGLKEPRFWWTMDDEEGHVALSWRTMYKQCKDRMLRDDRGYCSQLVSPTVRDLLAKFESVDHQSLMDMHCMPELCPILNPKAEDHE